MNWSMPIILASTSPRRREMLEATGWPVQVVEPEVDDGELEAREVLPRAWVTALAWFKARSVMLKGVGPGTILGADTVCELDGKIIGKPAHRADAGEMIRRFRNRSHQVMTGVCLVASDGSERFIFSDTATVTLGDLKDEAIESYLDTNAWQGKAGGYNLLDRFADGWPLEWDGDDHTITGLPMRRLREILDAAGMTKEDRP